MDRLSHELKSKLGNGRKKVKICGAFTNGPLNGFCLGSNMGRAPRELKTRMECFERFLLQQKKR